jgi:predicted amidophosphoribosyltransferase
MGVLDRVRTWLFPTSCVACDRPGIALCARCAPPPQAVVQFALGGVPAWALGPYEGALREAIVAMKRGERDPLDAFAALLDHLPIGTPLIPLPTSRGRVAQRGFDQALELARRVARRRALALVEPLVKHGRPQEGCGRHARLAAAGRFRLRPGVALPAEATLLDDVCTTGATLRDAAATLRAAGVAVAGIVVLARAGGTPSGAEWS